MILEILISISNRKSKSKSAKHPNSIDCRTSVQSRSTCTYGTHDPEIQATRNTSYLTASKSLNSRKIARMAPILTIFGPNRSQRRNLFFEKFSNERRRHRGIVVVVIVAVVVAVVAVVAVVGGSWVACIKGTSLSLGMDHRLKSSSPSQNSKTRLNLP